MSIWATRKTALITVDHCVNTVGSIVPSVRLANRLFYLLLITTQYKYKLKPSNGIITLTETDTEKNLKMHLHWEKANIFFDFSCILNIYEQHIKLSTKLYGSSVASAIA